MDADGLMSIHLWMNKLTMALEVSTYSLNSFGTLLLHLEHMLHAYTHHTF